MLDENIQYTVEFTKRKTIGIIITESGDVIVRAPNGTDIKAIEKVVNRKKEWITEKVTMFKGREQLKEDEVLYLGSVCKIKVLNQKFLKKNFVYFEGQTFYISVNDSSKANKTLENWMREQCLKKVKDLIMKHMRNFPSPPIEIRVKEQKKKWGCCTFDNKIFLNWRLIMARESAIEYVIIHEMCHMIHKNHSKEFWKLVEEMMPTFKKEHLYLKEKGYLMKINI